MQTQPEITIQQLADFNEAQKENVVSSENTQQLNTMLIEKIMEEAYALELSPKRKNKHWADIFTSLKNKITKLSIYFLSSTLAMVIFTSILYYLNESLFL